MNLSVVIPTLNEERSIQQSIQSAYESGATEVIVADGGSRDRTVDLASKQGAITVDSPAGRGPQMNRGAERASGDVLLFLHADCRLADQCGAQIAHAVEQGEQFLCFHQQILASHFLYRLIEKGNGWRAHFQRLPYGDQGIVVTKELFFSVGGYDEVPLMEDVVFARKAGKVSRPRLLPGPLLVSPRRWKQNGIIRQTLSNWLTMFRFRLGANPNQLVKSYYAGSKPKSAELNTKPDVMKSVDRCPNL